MSTLASEYCNTAKVFADLNVDGELLDDFVQKFIRSGSTVKRPMIETWLGSDADTAAKLFDFVVEARGRYWTLTRLLSLDSRVEAPPD